jgi:hypothetical protein
MRHKKGGVGRRISGVLKKLRIGEILALGK